MKLELFVLSAYFFNFVLGASPPLTRVSRALWARNAEKVSKMPPARDPKKVATKSWEQTQLLGLSLDFLETFSGSRAAGSGRHFQDFFGISGPECPRDPCKGRAGSQILWHFCSHRGEKREERGREERREERGERGEKRDQRAESRERREKREERREKRDQRAERREQREQKEQRERERERESSERRVRKLLLRRFKMLLPLVITNRNVFSCPVFKGHMV